MDYKLSPCPQDKSKSLGRPSRAGVSDLVLKTARSPKPSNSKATDNVLMTGKQACYLESTFLRDLGKWASVCQEKTLLPLSAPTPTTGKDKQTSHRSKLTPATSSISHHNIDPYHWQGPAGLLLCLPPWRLDNFPFPPAGRPSLVSLHPR